jgi:hypothetical protein
MISGWFFALGGEATSTIFFGKCSNNYDKLVD